jgi:NCAIR mutase (PurE)-related protein
MNSGALPTTGEDGAGAEAGASAGADAGAAALSTSSAAIGARAAAGAAEASPLGAFAELDFAREERCGFPEVVYGAGKTPEQAASIMAALVERHALALCTRASAAQADAVRAVLPDACLIASCGMLFVDRRAQDVRVTEADVDTILAGQQGAGHPGAGHPGAQRKGDRSPGAPAPSPTPPPAPSGRGLIVVCCAGTSDLTVAQEAAITARLMGSRVSLLTDVGISGVHRVLSHTSELHSARAIVAVAGMEGAQPSLVAGLVDVPVIAVPTSVGYGASFVGIAALLGMLNSCAGGVSVVNIDNGFGAGVIAHRINVPPARFMKAGESQ